MGESITIGDSLIITVFSMAVVFIVLYLISCLIRVLKIVSNGKEENKESSTPNIEEANAIEEIEEVEEEDEGELVAIIAAAIAASLDVSIPQIRIKEIRRVSQSTPVWADIGRREQMKGIIQ
ncbi:MAG TPA: OadG family protein [Tissierellaceae bacterium]